MISINIFATNSLFIGNTQLDHEFEYKLAIRYYKSWKR